MVRLDIHRPSARRPKPRTSLISLGLALAEPDFPEAKPSDASRFGSRDLLDSSVPRQLDNGDRLAASATGDSPAVSPLTVDNVSHPLALLSRAASVEVEEEEVSPSLQAVVAPTPAALKIAAAPEPHATDLTPPLREASQPPALAVRGHVAARHAALLVEGDPLHSLVLARRLRASGYEVEIANSASAAVEAFRRSLFGVVLIDCDSPEVDGYAATVAFRIIEGKENEGTENHTPIIAMTSETSAHDRALRKAAGFDNYLEKPVRPENLRVVLDRYSPTFITSGQDEFVDIDRTELAKLCALRSGGGAFLRDFVRTFLNQAQRLLSQMRTAALDSNPGVLIVRARTLKGLAQEVGATRMHDLCVIVQALASSGNLAAVPPQLATLSLAFERVSAQLRAAESDLLSGGEVDLGLDDDSSNLERTGRILVAEGDNLLSRFLLATLSSAGLEVFHAATGREALALFRERKVDVAVVDASLPEGDGYFVLKELRLDPKLFAVPVLILSERSHEQDVLRAFELGADDYVPTPFNPQEVSARVRNLLRRATRQTRPGPDVHTQEMTSRT